MVIEPTNGSDVGPLSHPAIDRARHRLAVGVVGGPTVVLDYAGLRLVAEPTFDDPTDYGPYRKLTGPAVRPEDLGPVDAVLVSHDLHMDNFDHAGRAFAAAAPLVLTGPLAAARLGGNARGLASYASTSLVAPGGTEVSVHAVPAQHGPADGDRDEYGHVNTEVTGFVLSADGLPTVYVSGDNASIGPVADIAGRFPDVAVAVLNVGAARVPAKFDGRPLTLTADRAGDVATLLGTRVVVPAHCEGWSLYSQSTTDVRASFADAGIADQLRIAEPGRWAYVGD